MKKRLSKEQARQVQLAKMRQSPIGQARRNLGSYYLAQNPGYVWVDFQQEKIVPALEAVANGEIKRLMIWQHPGSSKSDLSTRAFIPWWMGRNPTKNAMVVSYSAELASKDFGAAIKVRLSSESHLALFPNSRPTADSRASSLLKTISGGTLYTSGFDGSLAGKRVDLLDIDDPIKNQDEADSEARENFLFNIYDTVVKARLRPGGAIILVMTRWAIRDIAARILEAEGEVTDGGAWTVLKLPAQDANGNYLWESFYGRQHYEDAKFARDGSIKDSWYSVWQQTPGQSNEYLFKEDWLQYYDVPIPPGKFNAYLMVDPANAKGKLSDYTAMWVVVAGPNKNIFVVDGAWDRYDPGERSAEFLRLCRRWNPKKIIYEEYGLLNDTYYLKRIMEEQDFKVFPIPVGRSGPRHNLSKHERIKQVVPWFREGRIFLLRQINRKLTSGQVVNITQRFVDAEYKLYKGPGSIPHEDQLDCMARIMDVVAEGGFQFAEPVDDEDEEEAHGMMPGQTWQSIF